MNARKLKRAKAQQASKAAVKELKKLYKQYAAQVREMGIEPLSISDWIKAETKTW